ESDFLLEEVDAFLALEDDPTSRGVDHSYYDPEGKICEAEKDKSSIDERLEVELKDLPPHLEYAFLEGDDKLPIIIAKDLSVEEKAALIKVLKSHNQAIAWKLSEIKDQEKTTFTCLYETFAYRRMPFGLCNALGTFQRCVMAIFHDMIKKTMEVFMDDFSVFGSSFETCLSYLGKMLKRCEDTNLCLNWEKSHFMVKEGIVLSVFGNSFENCLSRLDKMLQRSEDTNLSLNWEKSHFKVKEGIVLGHKISKNEIEVDRAKVNVIAKLPHPTTVKGIQSFLG
nr:reverse transcriptase domain-containing protein [Tanacetum cinerariifolium]